MCKAEEVNSPDTDYEGVEGILSYEVDTEEDDGEKGGVDRKEMTESEPVKESSGNSSGQTVHHSIHTCMTRHIYSAMKH